MFQSVTLGAVRPGGGEDDPLSEESRSSTLGATAPQGRHAAGAMSPGQLPWGATKHAVVSS